MPLFTRPPLPEMTPSKLVEVLSPPVVRMFAPSKTLPDPASEPIVSDAPTPRRAGAVMVTATVSASAAPPVRFTSPPLIVTGPVKVLAPPSSSRPGPFLTRPAMFEIALSARIVELPVPSLPNVKVCAPLP